MEADDLVKRLREAAVSGYVHWLMLKEAADMIEQMADRISVAELAAAEAHHAD